MADDDEPCDGVLALVGLRGTGKTTVGLQCAHRLGVPFVDLDAVLETLGPTIVRLGKTPVGPEPVGELLERIGLDLFRWLENRALHGLFLGPADLERPDADRDRAALAGWDVSRTRIAVGRRRLEPTCVLATGGGVLERESNRHLLRDRANVVWLDAPTPVLAQRIAADATHRPPISGAAPSSRWRSA